VHLGQVCADDETSDDVLHQSFLFVGRHQAVEVPRLNIVVHTQTVDGHNIGSTACTHGSVVTLMARGYPAPPEISARSR
jgi:hypothetical protein